jgi:predicted AAA+ superfamily ATPase
MFASEFKIFISLNLEREADRAIFEKTDSIADILNAIYLLKNIVPQEGETLLFIDEIQESPKAIQLFRYFHEERPELFVIAAGSLLEFSLKEVASFPVGRIEYLCLHPMDFEEFLMAMGYQAAFEQLQQIPVPSFAHATLLNLFHNYAIIGGMPAVLSEYARTKNIAGVARIYSQLWQAYKDDSEKYAKNNTARRVIRHILETAPHETDRITFERFGRSSYRSREVGEAMRALDMARVVQLIYPTTSVTPPIITDFKKRPRLRLLDTGLLNQAAGLQGPMIGVRDLNDFYRGKIIQHLVTQELIAIHDQPSYRPHFWIREEGSTTSEVDLVLQHDQYIIPIEIKSGPTGRLRSLHEFIDRCDHRYGIRMSPSTLAIEKARTPRAKKDFLLANLPYYLAVKLPEYIAWFCEHHKV